MSAMGARHHRRKRICNCILLQDIHSSVEEHKKCEMKQGLMPSWPCLQKVKKMWFDRKIKGRLKIDD